MTIRPTGNARSPSASEPTSAARVHERATIAASVNDGAISHKIDHIEITRLKASPRNARSHSKKQIAQIANSIQDTGYFNPILGCGDLAAGHIEVVAGHGRLQAALKLGLETVPVIVLSGLTERQKSKLRLADNKIAANAGWNTELLAIELNELTLIDELDGTGFSVAEADRIIFDYEHNSSDPADQWHPPAPFPVSKRGDLWIAGQHRILCGDAREMADHQRLMEADLAAMAFEDVPYNLKISSIVGRGKIKHDEFPMGSGEMTREEFRSFLKTCSTNAAKFSRDGAIHYLCIDWRSVADLTMAVEDVYGLALNIIAWVKPNAGQGSFYRSQHEFIAVFRVGGKGHQNNIELGRHGRNRSNVWQYAGVNSFGKDRLEDLASHPTVKPVAMIADAMKDCTKRNDIVLDTFSGSGTTMLAAERVGRRARLIEYEPGYVDVAVRRWQTFTGQDAVHIETGMTFDETEAAGKARS